MSRLDEACLDNIVKAITVIEAHLTRGDLHDELVYDGVRVRLIEIGEAVKGLRPEFLNEYPHVPWAEIARMQDHLAHRYFNTGHGIVQDVVSNELGPLPEAVRALIGRNDPHGSGTCPMQPVESSTSLGVPAVSHRGI